LVAYGLNAKFIAIKRGDKGNNDDLNVRTVICLYWGALELPR
jgi:hypothetical protein